MLTEVQLASFSGYMPESKKEGKKQEYSHNTVPTSNKDRASSQNIGKIYFCLS